MCKTGLVPFIISIQNRKAIILVTDIQTEPKFVFVCVCVDSVWRI